MTVSYLLKNKDIFAPLNYLALTTKSGSLTAPSLHTDLAYYTMPNVFGKECPMFISILSCSVQRPAIPTRVNHPALHTAEIFTSNFNSHPK